MGRNILFITTDQQRYDALGCNGGKIAQTPVADQLAQNAVDMVSYPEDTGPPTTAPHRALQKVRENLDYLERFLGP